ncbi:MAG TPA: hypothetical protein PKA90_15795 [Ignavibacteria bacterium]|nr:hypothetical protein [Ignavibacteria bacterium]
MKKTLLKLVVLLNILFFCSSFSYAGITFFQSNKINKDGSVSVSITYSASTQEVTSKKNIIGNLPFTNQLIKEYFNFPGVKLTKAISYKDPKNASNTAVTVEFNGGNLVKISESKALTGIKANVLKKDSGYVVSWFVPSSFYSTNSIETYQFLTKSEVGIKSTNGVLKDGEIKWYVFGNKVTGDGSFFVTTVNADGIKPGSSSNNNEEGNKTENNKEEKSGSCGLFGMELPFVLLTGLVLSRKFRKK